MASVFELLVGLRLGGKNRLINFILRIALNFHISNSAYLFLPINYTYRYIEGGIVYKRIFVDRKCDRTMIDCSKILKPIKTAQSAKLIREVWLGAVPSTLP